MSEWKYLVNICRNSSFSCAATHRSITASRSPAAASSALVKTWTELIQALFHPRIGSTEMSLAAWRRVGNEFEQRGSPTRVMGTLGLFVERRRVSLASGFSSRAPKRGRGVLGSRAGWH